MIKIATTGLIGYETARRLFDEHEEELRERFSKRFIADFLRLSEKNCCIDVEKIADDVGVYTDICPRSVCLADELHDEEGLRKKLQPEGGFAESSLTNDNFKVYITTISEGGLFAALWRACEDLKLILNGEQVAGKTAVAGKRPVGCEVDLNSICIRQEVIEISELYDENPYEAPSRGAWLILWDEEKEDDLSEHLRDIIKDADKIGRITKKNDRILTGAESIRFLTPPARQEKDIRDRRQNSAIDTDR